MAMTRSPLTWLPSNGIETATGAGGFEYEVNERCKEIYDASLCRNGKFICHLSESLPLGDVKCAAGRHHTSIQSAIAEAVRESREEQQDEIDLKQAALNGVGKKLDECMKALREMYDTACTNATSTPSKKAFLVARDLIYPAMQHCGKSPLPTTPEEKR